MSAGKIPPTVYLLDGEDDLAIAEFIASLQARLGDPTAADMNTTRLDGRNISLEELNQAVFAMPFLARRRLVILTHPLAQLKSKEQREKFKDLLAKIPVSTALLLVDTHLYGEESSQRGKSVHWLEAWAAEHEAITFKRSFPLPSGKALEQWIGNRAKAAGGQFTPAAAAALARLVGEDLRLADQEIQKLLAYVNYARPVEADDVESLTPLSAPVPDFALANALRARNRRQALEVLHRLLADQDAIPLFHSIVYEFRLLLLAREMLDQGKKDEGELAKALGVKPYPARLAMENARRFSLPTLEAIYRRLLDLDEAIKTGQMTGDLALELLVTRLTN